MSLSVATVDGREFWDGLPAKRAMTVQNKRASAEPDLDLAGCMAAIAGKRDREAFAKLFGHMAPRVKAYCMKRGSSPAAAEEAAQETMIQVWRRAEQFDPDKASVTTWIYTIARNKRIDLFRKEQRPEITADDLMQTMSDVTDAQSGLELAQAGDSLAEKVAELSDEQAEVIKKAFYEDKTHPVIAEELGLPLGTVKSRIRLALAKLRMSMAEYE